MKKRINLICYISFYLLGIYISVYQSVIKNISSEYSMSAGITGAIISLHFIGSLVSPAIFGEMSDRYGKKIIVLIAFYVLISGLMTIYLFNNLLMISAGIFLVGCGFSVVEGMLSGVLSDENSNEINKVMNFSQMFFSIGAVTGPLMALKIVELCGRWKAAYLLMAALFGLSAFYLTGLKFGIHNNNIKKDTGLISYRLLKENMFLLLCTSIFIYVGIEEGVAFWLGAYFDNLNFSNQKAAYTLSGYWASMIIGRYLAGRYHSKFAFFLNAGLNLSLAFIITGLLLVNETVSFICFTVVGLGFSAVWPIIISITASLFPEYTGTALGIMMSFGAAGGIIIPFILGLLANSVTIKQAFWFFPVMIAFLLVIQKRIVKYTMGLIQSKK